VTKVAEFHELSDEQLLERLESNKDEIFNLRFQLATGQLDNPMRIKTVRHDVARILTVLRQRHLELEVEQEVRQADAEAMAEWREEQREKKERKSLRERRAERRAKAAEEAERADDAEPSDEEGEE
jgi:large subunit ribosomal protein L29